jgi:hypothetical protein
VSREPDQDIVKFCFRCNCSKEILANGGQEVLDELYSEYQIPKSEYIPDYDITLGIDVSKFPKTQKIKKTMDEAESAAVKAENEEIRKKRDKIVDEVCLKFSQFKKDFLGAPIRRALKHLKASNTGNPSHSCEIPYRIDEKYWVVSEKDGVSVSFSLQFDN